MQRDRFKLGPRKKRRKRRPGLQKQTKLKRGKSEKRRFDFAGSINLPGLLQRDTRPKQRQTQAAPAPSTRRKSNRKGVVQAMQERKRRMELRPMSGPNASVREIVQSARLISFALLVLCIYAIWQIGNNPRFYLSRIEIDGATILQPGDIVSSSGAYGTHVFAIKPDLAAAQVNAMPGVKSAQVDLVWPDRLHITIEEEEPVLNWRENGRDYWVNASGNLIPAFGQDMSLLTVVADVPPFDPGRYTELVLDADGILTQVEYDTSGKPIATYFDEEGEELEIEPLKMTYLDFVPDAVTAMALNLKQERPEIEQLIYSPASGLQFWDSRGWIAKFGAGDDLVTKVNVYEAIVSNMQARGIVPEYVSVVHPTKPVFKPISGYTPPATDGTEG